MEFNTMAQKVFSLAKFYGTMKIKDFVSDEVKPCALKTFEYFKIILCVIVFDFLIQIKKVNFKLS